jgi:hypothetical protein
MEDTTVATGIQQEETYLRACARCGLTYDWRRSPSSSLKMTYCGSLCERADLGFTIEALLRLDIQKTETEPLRLEDPVAA